MLVVVCLIGAAVGQEGEGAGEGPLGRLASKDPKTRARAARFLGRERVEEAAPALRKALEK